VSQALVYGDRRPYPVALITLQAEDLGRLARGAGLAGRPASEVVVAPPVRARVQSIVDAANRHLASYAQVKRFAIVPTDFSQETGELTPTLKLRRREVCRKYEALLEGLYRDTASPPAP
jgi:long-chain acyl-CoA synthetase